MSWRQPDESAVTTLQPPEPSHEADPTPPQSPKPGLTGSRKLAVAVILVALGGGMAWQLVNHKGKEVGTVPTTEPKPGRPSVPGNPSRPPELRNTGEDFDTIVRSVKEFENWVYQHDPDPKWVDSIFDPGNQDEFGFEWAKRAMTALQSAGNRYDAPRVRVRKVIVRDRVSDHQVGVYVVYEGLPANVIDRDGKVSFPQKATPPTGYLEDWVRGEDGRWRLAHSVLLGPPDPEIVR